MSEIYAKLFVCTIVAYFIILNLTLILIVEPKFVVKYYGQKVWYQKFRNAFSGISLVSLFLASFFLGMFAFLMKLFNTMVIL